MTEYSDNYSKTSGSWWQYCRDKPALNDNGVIVNDIDNDNGANVTDSFNFKVEIIGQIDDYGIKIFEIMVPTKYLSNFWKTLEMLLISCEINLILNWSANCVIVPTAVANQGATFAVTDTKLYVHVVTLPSQDNVKLLRQLKSGFKRTVNWNKYQPKATIQART